MNETEPPNFVPAAGHPAPAAGRRPSVTTTRALGALALLVTGGVHFQQYRYDFYSSIPTIGPLFLANFVGATALGLFLLSPSRAPGRVGRLLDQVAALAGVGLAAGGFVGLLISEHTPLFGFTEHGYRFAIVLALASEAVAMTMLTLFLVRGRTGAHGSHDEVAPRTDRRSMRRAGPSAT
jgi:MFS family permease